MTDPALHLKLQWGAVHQADKDLADLRRLGIEETHPVYQKAWQARGAALAQIGHVKPRVQAWVMDWATWSPTRVRLMEDTELGFVAVIKAYEGAVPIYKRVSAEVAAAIIKEEVSPELREELLTPVEYYGE